MARQMLYGFLDKKRKLTDDENRIAYNYLDKINGKVVHFNIQPFYTRHCGMEWIKISFYR